MPSTRSSTRAAAASSSPSKSRDDSKTAAGSKRKAENTTSPQSRRGKKSRTKKQSTIDESLSADRERDLQQERQEETAQINGGEVKDPEPAEKKETGSPGRVDAREEPKQNGAISDATIKTSKDREESMPSTILEKGIIYFFTRGRVGVEEPESVNDLQRSYFVLRPLPKGAKLGDGPIEDLKNNRLFALPKKVWPKSHRDRFMGFVEKANRSIQDLKDNFFKGSEYSTKTSGTRQTPPVSPVGEGVYAITSAGRSTHLVYMLTIPSELGEVQKELGLRSKGSFVMNVKNPERPGPASARLPQGPDFPKEFIEEFRGLAWVVAEPKYLDYERAQILLIGEGTDENFANALESSRKDEKEGKDTPVEVVEQLEHEDELRVEHLHGDDSIYDDLEISKKEYPAVLTTW